MPCTIGEVPLRVMPPLKIWDVVLVTKSIVCINRCRHSDHPASLSCDLCETQRSPDCFLWKQVPNGGILYNQLKFSFNYIFKLMHHIAVCQKWRICSSNSNKNLEQMTCTHSKMFQTLLRIHTGEGSHNSSPSNSN